MMAVLSKQAEYRPPARFRPCGAALLWLVLAMMLCQGGCGGCRKTPEAEEQEKQQAEEKAKKKKEKEKEAFEAQQPAGMPSNKDLAGACKPGHWTSLVWPDVKANRGDFQGELHTEIIDGAGRKLPLIGVPYELTTERPVALAKEQPKSLESLAWIPLRQDAASVNFKLAASGGGPMVLERSIGLHCMPSYRYFFVVLSKVAGRYEYLDKKLASVHLQPSTSEAGAGTKFYEVVSMPAGAPGTPGSTAGSADQRLVLDEHRLSALGRLRPGAVGRRSTAGPDRLAALGRADHRQRSRCPGATSQQLPAALPAGQRGEVARVFDADDLAGTSILGGRTRPSPDGR